jgi:RNA polymerase sigma-70 factor (ECF subfamily)
MQQDQGTSLSLLERVQGGDPVAWGEFSKIYMSVLRKWCLQWGLQSADADDLMQETWLVLIGQIARFRHRGLGSFRSWMRTVAWHCLCAAIARSEKARRSEQLNQILASARARETLEEEIDQMCDRQMLEDAMQLVAERVRPSTWLAFQKMALEGLSAKQVSEATGLHPEAVYASRARVQRLVHRELRRLMSTRSQ